MDMIFQNITDITDEVLHESSKNYNVYNKNLRITILLASLISVVYMIVGLNKKLYSVCLVELVMALFFLIIFFNGYILKAKQNYKNMQVLYEKQPQSIFTFFADDFEFVAEDIKSRADYNQVTKMIETQNLYMLIIEKQMLILNKNSFTVGDAKVFKKFIFENCKNILK